MSDRRMSRRRMLGAIAAGAIPGALAAQDTLAGGGALGTLQFPTVAGRPRDTTVAGDNDLAIRALEKRLKCPCPCGLDVYTCRTTDFTCTYSPESHREVMALWRQGKSADEIIATFVEEYGERALMAPVPRGFNLTAYLLPGALILLLGFVLAFAIRRRTRPLASAPGANGPVGADIAGATTEELAELRRLVQDDT